MIPPAGPARLAKTVRGSLWTVEGDQLIKKDLGLATVRFGDESWSDYDFTFDASKRADPDGLRVMFRGSQTENYGLNLGGDKFTLVRVLLEKKQHSELQSMPGTIRPGGWYKLKVSLRGTRIRIELDEHVLFDCTDDVIQKGSVGLHWFTSTGRFRNIKVTAPDGTVLWEGPPDLPKE